jgi:hypothetical protein
MLKKLRIQTEDMLWYNPVVRGLLAAYTLLRTPGTAAANTVEAARIIYMLCQAARLSATEAMILKAETAIARQLPAINPEQVP